MIVDHQLAQPDKDIKYRAVMICDLTNSVSLQYSKIARETFQSTSKIDIELWQCFTPETRINNPYKIKWADYDARSKYKGKHRIIPDQEKACFESHFYWWMHIAKTSEQVIIMEHDAYCRNVYKFESLVNQIPNHTLWNCGLAMECYTMLPSFARFIRTVCFNRAVEGGPMAELWDHINCFYKTKRSKKQNIKPTLWPTKFYNKIRSESNPNDCICTRNNDSLQNAPVTQCYSNVLGNTIEHDTLYNPTNNPDIEFIDNV